MTFEPNPFQSPSAECSPSPPAEFRFGRLSPRGILLLATFIGFSIGTSIALLRCLGEGFYLEEGFYWADYLRDVIVGILVGFGVGVIWSAYCNLRLRHKRTKPPGG